MPKIYIAVCDGGDGSYSIRKFASQEHYDQHKEAEEASMGYSTDDNGGYVIDTDNIKFDDPDEIEIDEEEEDND